MTTLREVKARVAGLPEGTQKSIVCALVGHSRIERSCFGQITCARCDAIVGDTLAGCYDTSKSVIVGHNCPTCQANYKALDWRSKFMAPDPFKED